MGILDRKKGLHYRHIWQRFAEQVRKFLSKSKTERKEMVDGNPEMREFSEQRSNETTGGRRIWLRNRKLLADTFCELIPSIVIPCNAGEHFLFMPHPRSCPTSVISAFPMHRRRYPQGTGNPSGVLLLLDSLQSVPDNDISLKRQRPVQTRSRSSSRKKQQ